VLLLAGSAVGQDPRTGDLLARTIVNTQPTSHPAWCVQCNHGEGLPTFDIRASDPLYNALALGPAQTAAAAADKAADSLRAHVPGLAIDSDWVLGTPAFVRSPFGMLTPPSDEDAWKVLGGFIDREPGLLGVGSGELRSNRITRDFVMAHNGVRHITLQQQHAGVDIFSAIMRTSLTKRGEVINVSSTLLPRPTGGFKVDAPTLAPAKAIVLASADAGITINEDVLKATEVGDGPALKTTWAHGPELRADEPVVTALVYFPLTRDLIVPAWTVVVPQNGVGHTYDTIVDATTGAILYRTNRLMCAQPITMNVFLDSPAPMSPGTPTPTSVQAPIVSQTTVTINPADVAAWSPQGWIPDGTFETVGNNIDAHTDTNGDNTADTPRPAGTVVGGSLTFSDTVNLALAPSGYKNASVVQMFYFTNRYHDRLYSLGFNEAAGNFQNDNFGHGGVAGDRVQADVQDGSGTNNANFSTTGTDGSSARVQMYVFTAPTPDRDGALESDVVNHEMTHGVSTRLHGSLSTTVAGGMGEGWSDFYAMCFNAGAGDDPDAVYPMGPYNTYLLSGMTSNYYFGIRRYPYCTNLNKNPLTYADIDPAQFAVDSSIPIAPGTFPVGDVHSIGEVWCMALMECRANLARPGMMTLAANQLAMQIVLDGMALAPANPTFIQSRDSILQAELTDSGGTNAAAFWTGFAKRGLGSGASGPSNGSNTPVVESYAVPFFASFSFPDGLPTQLLPGVATTFRVSITGTGLSLIDDTGTVSYRVNGGSYTTTAMTHTGTNQYTATISAQSCFAKVDYYFTTGTSMGNKTSPSGAPTTFDTAKVFSSLATIVSDNFETDTGWIVGPNTATSGIWVRGDPNGTSAQPEDDHTAAPGVNCWFTGQATAGAADGTNDIDGGYTQLTSPAYDLSAYPDATVSYWRWYSNGLGAAPFADTFRVQVSTNNGSTWTIAETVGPASSPDTQPGWRPGSFTFSGLGLTPTSQVKVRFIAEDAGSGSLVEAAVDDFSITALLCTPPGPAQCTAADMGTQGGQAGFDGLLDNNDFVVFINRFFNNDLGADLGSQGGIPTPDGMLDNNDFVVFIDLFFTGCS
jgi:hypothetical protein